ncbi:MAG: hypothetical protein SFU98_21180 [Leptospiraceae bacterium]|nr:hypothetical protein [Leptospiraceae bacterium]
MVLKGKLKSAIQIYSRTLPRLKDQSARIKLKSVLEYLQGQLGTEKPLPEKKKKKDKKEKKEKLDKPEKDLDSAIQEISEDLAGSLAKDLIKLEKTLEKLPDQISVQVGPTPNQPNPADYTQEVKPETPTENKANIQTIIYSGQKPSFEIPPKEKESQPKSIGSVPYIPTQEKVALENQAKSSQDKQEKIDLDKQDKLPQDKQEKTDQSKQVSEFIPPREPIQKNFSGPEQPKSDEPVFNFKLPEDYGQAFLGVNPESSPVRREDIFSYPKISSGSGSKSELAANTEPKNRLDLPEATQTTEKIISENTELQGQLTQGSGDQQPSKVTKSLKARAEEYIALQQQFSVPILGDFNLPEGETLTAAEFAMQQSLSSLDLLNKLYAAEGWQQFKNLPFSDRRFGTDRRVLHKPVPKERRSGIERRKQNLLDAREDYINEWKEQISQEFPEMQSLDDTKVLPRLIPSSNRGGKSGRRSTDLPIEGLSTINLPDPNPDSDQVTPKNPIDQDQAAKEVSELPSEDIQKPVRHLEPANEEVIKTIGEKGLLKIDLPEANTLRYEGYEDAPKRNISASMFPKQAELGEIKTDEEGKATIDGKELTPTTVLYPTFQDEKIHELFTIELPDPIDHAKGETPKLPNLDGDMPEIETGDEVQELEIPQIEPEPEPERVIHGVLELKPPEVDDAPFLTLTYDFSKIPHSFRLSKNYSIMEYSYYKYKPMLIKAQEFARRKMLKNALNYYRVIKSQNIPPELKRMINRNIIDITEFLEKFLMRGGSI